MPPGGDGGLHVHLHENEPSRRSGLRRRRTGGDHLTGEASSQRTTTLVPSEISPQSSVTPIVFVIAA